METVFVLIEDTLKTTSVNASIWVDYRFLIPLTISLFALFITILWNFFAMKNSQRKDINDKWAELTVHRIKLKNALDKAYSVWPSKSKRSLIELLLVVKIPSEILNDNSIDGFMENLPSAESELYNFCSDLYDNEKDDSIWKKLGNDLDVYGFNDFRVKSSTIIWYLNGWSETSNQRIPPLFLKKYLVERFKSDFIYFRLFTWLELALRQSIGALWSDRSRFFKLAYDIEKARI